MTASPLDSASHWLNWSNILYVAGAVLTLIAAMYVLYENRQIALGRRVKHYLLSEIGVVAAAIVSLVGTIGAIHYSNSVGHLKDVDLEKYKAQAGIQIAQAQGDAAKATLDAGTATTNAGKAQEKAEQARQKAEAIHAKAEEDRTNSLEAERKANEAVIDKEKILGDNLALQKQVETERISRLQLEQRLAPRGLLKNPQDSLSSKVRPFAGISVDMVVVSGNSEAQNLAGQIAFGLKAGGVEYHMLFPIGGSTQGVGIEFEPEDANARKIAQAIHDALAESSISSELIPMLPPMDQQVGAYTSDGGPGTGKGKVRIFIGNKP